MAGIKRSWGGGSGPGKRFKFSKRTRRAYRKKAAYKKRGVTKNKTNVSIGRGFPKKMTMTHKYTEVIGITSVAGVFGSYNFSCNGMFDPNITGTGHQPYYFDQMSALYDHYTVIGSKAKYKICSQDSSETPYRWGAFINDDTTTTVTQMDGISENSSGTVFMVGPGRNTTRQITKKWSAKKTFGGSVLGNDNLQGTPSSNPTEQSYFTFCLQGLGSADVTVFLEMEIEYIAVWDELKDIAMS